MKLCIFCSFIHIFAIIKNFNMKKSKIIILSLVLHSGGVYSQQKGEIFKVLDSISHKKWDSIAPNLDSLDNPKLTIIDKKFSDKVVIRPKDNTLIIKDYDIPITPYNLMKTQTHEQRWFFYGQNNLLFNQASFSNWNAGGNNNIGVIGKVNYNLIYKKNRHYLENIFNLRYGFVAQEGSSTRKTEDYISVSSNYGYELNEAYYLSTGFQFISQFTRGYNYGVTPNPTKMDRISQFMAPGYLNLGLGLSYNPNENLQVILRPINGQFTFVTDSLLQKAGRYGLERDGQSLRAELGARLNALYRIKIYNDIHYTNQLSLFSNYLSHPERVDIAYSGILNMKFNKYLNAMVSIDLIYDHDQIKQLQRKQTLGIGLSYTLGSESNKDSNKKLLKINTK